MPAIEIRPEPLPVTLTTGVCPRGAQVRALAGLSMCPASSARQIHAAGMCTTPYRRPLPARPARDLLLVALDGPVDRHLRCPSEAAQHRRYALEAVPDPEPGGDRLSHSGQGPPCILGEPRRGRPWPQQLLKLPQLLRTQPRRRAAGAFRGQGRLASRRKGRVERRIRPRWRPPGTTTPSWRRASKRHGRAPCALPFSSSRSIVIHDFGAVPS